MVKKFNFINKKNFIKKTIVGGNPLKEREINKTSPFLLNKEELLPFPLISLSNLNSFNKKIVKKKENQ